MKQVTVGDGNLQSYKKHQKNGNSRLVTNEAGYGEDTRKATTTKDGNEVEVLSTTTKSGTSVTVEENNVVVGTAQSVRNSDGTTTVTTSTGKSKTISK